MGTWFDKLAKSAARRAAAQPAAPAAEQEDSSGVTRRDALRRAGVVGAVVFSAPVIQSMTTPAWAKSSPPAQGTCKDPSDSSAGPCGGSGGCPKCGAGKACYRDSDCLSKDCDGYDPRIHKAGTCAQSTLTERCYGDSDCTSGRCRDYVNGIGTCKSQTPGGPCKDNKDCESGTCNKQTLTCAKSPLGGKCKTTNDCASGTCTKGVCK